MAPLTTATRKRRELTNDELKQVLDRTGVEQFTDTVEAASLLRVKPQTMRRWACYGSGPIQARRVAGRLRWAVADIKKLLAVLGQETEATA